MNTELAGVVAAIIAVGFAGGIYFLRRALRGGADRRVLGEQRVTDLQAEGCRQIKQLVLRASDPNCPPIVFDSIDIPEARRIIDDLKEHSVAARHVALLAMERALDVDVATGLLVSQALIGRVNPSHLLQYQYGILTSVLHNGVTKRGLHIAMNTAQVMTPLLVFQALSVVTGQYYAHAIDRQMDEIRRSVEQLLAWHHAEKVGVIRAAEVTLRRLAARQTVSIDDLCCLSALGRDVLAVQQQHIALLNHVDPMEVWESECASRMLTTKRLSAFEKITKRQQVDLLLGVITACRWLSSVAHLIEIRMTALLGARDPAHAVRLQELILGWPKVVDATMREVEQTRYTVAGIMVARLNVLKHLGNHAFRQQSKKEVQDRLEDRSEELREVETDNEIGTVLNELTHRVNSEYGTPRQVLLVEVNGKWEMLPVLDGCGAAQKADRELGTQADNKNEERKAA